jgi:hypothetical protein
MAGGKETPRQKMIGMMYLVLTALLALNVSKSILDAFVAIEENIQKANLTELYRGDEKRAELKETASDKTNPGRAAKADMLGKVIEEIDKMTAERIKLIDDIKYEILEACGEDMNASGEEAIVVEKYDDKRPCKPARMNLAHVAGKDKYDDPMRVMLGDATDIKNPKGRGEELWKSLNDYRKLVTEKLAATQVITGKNNKPEFDSKFSFKAPEINAFENQADLNKQIKKAIASSKVHPDDVDAILEIYRGLTKEEFSEVHDVKGVHWMGKTFDHSPSVAAIASLSSLQKDVLAARAQALSLIRSRVGGGEYSFNKIIPLAYGPEVVNANEEFTVEVLMAAYDSDKQPKVVYNGAEVKEVRDGKGYVKIKASGGKMELGGTVAIQNKSGIWKEKKWTKTVTVMKPSGSIELPELNVLYRGYANKVDPTASGFPETVLTGSNCSVSRSGEVYVVKPGKGKKAYLTVSGRSADGKTVQLKKVEYRVSNLPDPVLYWGSAKSGTKGAKSSRLLQAKYPPEIPLKATFQVIKWTCYAPGLKGAPPSGVGTNLGSAGPLINAVKPGTGLSFNATVRGPDGIARQVGGSWSL